MDTNTIFWIGMGIAFVLICVQAFRPVKKGHYGAITINTGPKGGDLGSYNTRVEKAQNRDAWSQ